MLTNSGILLCRGRGHVGLWKPCYWTLHHLGEAIYFSWVLLKLAYQIRANTMTVWKTFTAAKSIRPHMIHGLGNKHLYCPAKSLLSQKASCHRCSLWRIVVDLLSTLQRLSRRNDCHYIAWLRMLASSWLLIREQMRTLKSLLVSTTMVHSCCSLLCLQFLPTCKLMQENELANHSQDWCTKALTYGTSDFASRGRLLCRSFPALTSSDGLSQRHSTTRWRGKV